MIDEKQQFEHTARNIRGIIGKSKNPRNTIADSKNQSFTSAAYWDERCLKLWGTIVKAGGECEYIDPFTKLPCGGCGVLDPHHFVRRGFWPLRHDILNGVALGRRHHQLADQYPEMIEEYMRTYRPYDLEHIRHIERTSQGKTVNGVLYYTKVFPRLWQLAGELGLERPSVSPAAFAHLAKLT